MNYSYPMDSGWSTEEIIDVVKFFEFVEKAYEGKVQKEQFMGSYRRFKQIVPGKADEKRITDEFQENSGYSAYLVIKKAKEMTSDGYISIKA
ncbi:UPF0223 family protein [Actinomycetes bacterium NPDC127524]|uniref:UPF0223 family protein n=1 Tax=Bacillus sp. OV322 TaxID=1882764 RepID=UPI0008E865A8|nr:UPF0223 family protein [Bacillus sp. OV322]SFC04043.1 Uncharacterized protein YktA, UPF0223 family [Bacillus sp. OV322]